MTGTPSTAEANRFLVRRSDSRKAATCNRAVVTSGYQEEKYLTHNLKFELPARQTAYDCYANLLQLQRRSARPSALDYVQEPSGGGTVCYSSFYGLDFPTLDGPLYILGDALIHANYTVFDFDNAR